MLRLILLTLTLATAQTPAGPPDGGQLKVTPLRPVAEILAESMKAQPPVEPGPFRPNDLVVGSPGTELEFAL